MAHEWIFEEFDTKCMIKCYEGHERALSGTVARISKGEATIGWALVCGARDRFIGFPRSTLPSLEMFSRLLDAFRTVLLAP